MAPQQVLGTTRLQPFGEAKSSQTHDVVLDEASHPYTGWWFQPTPLKNDGVKVSWDDDIPNMMGQS